MADFSNLSFFEVVVMFTTFLIPIALAYKYHTARQQRNTKILDSLSGEKIKNFKLIRNLGYKYFCPIDLRRKKFVIKAGAVVQGDGKNYQIILGEETAVPAKVDSIFGTEYPTLFILEIPKKFLEETSDTYRGSEFEVMDLSFRKKTFCL